MYNPFSLENKTILITGASSGIGRTTAIECSKLGARCVITGRNRERLQETFDLLYGDEHVQFLADLTTESDVKSLVSYAHNVDGVVNNAGISYTKPIAHIKSNDLTSVFSSNVFAPMMLMTQLLKNKKLNNNASVVFVSSAASFNPDVANSVYSATKAALASFSRSCAKEFSNKLIRSNAVHPGMIKTNLVDNLVFSDEELKKDMERYPLKRYGSPEDVAWAIVYLLSDASSWVTGTSLVVDGGILLV